MCRHNISTSPSSRPTPGPPAPPRHGTPKTSYIPEAIVQPRVSTDAAARDGTIPRLAARIQPAVCTVQIDAFSTRVRWKAAVTALCAWLKGTYHFMGRTNMRFRVSGDAGILRLCSRGRPPAASSSSRVALVFEGGWALQKVRFKFPSHIHFPCDAVVVPATEARLAVTGTSWPQVEDGRAWSDHKKSCLRKTNNTHPPTFVQGGRTQFPYSWSLRNVNVNRIYRFWAAMHRTLQKLHWTDVRGYKDITRMCDVSGNDATGDIHFTQIKVITVGTSYSSPRSPSHSSSRLSSHLAKCYCCWYI